MTFLLVRVISTHANCALFLSLRKEVLVEGTCVKKQVVKQEFILALLSHPPPNFGFSYSQIQKACFPQLSTVDSYQLRDRKGVSTKSFCCEYDSLLKFDLEAWLQK